MSVTDLNHTIVHVCHLIDVFLKLLKVFHDYCLFKVSDQLVVGICFYLLLIENYRNKILALQQNHSSELLRRTVTQITKNGLNAQQLRQKDGKLPQKACES